MAEKVGLMREKIEETKSELSEDLASLEGQLRGKVESVKDELRKVSPSHQIRENPLWALGGAVVAGAAIGWAASRPEGDLSDAAAEPKAPKPRGPGRFDEEWNLVKGVALGALARNFGKVVKQAVPSLQNEIDEVISRIANKVEAPHSTGRPQAADNPSSQEWSPGSTEAPTPEGESKSYH